MASCVVEAKALDVHVLRSIPTPIADVLLSQGCRSAGDLLAKPDVLREALSLLHVADAAARAGALLDACQREVAGSWGSANSALELLKQAQAHRPVSFPCGGLSRLLGNALRPGGTILEVCGLPGTGKTQFCMQLCAAAQIPVCEGAAPPPLAQAIYIDAEGSFTPERYAQMCRSSLAERRAAFTSSGMVATVAPAAVNPLELEAVLRGMHVCRTYDAAELYSTVKQLGQFLRARPQIRAVVIDSIAFFFRHEFANDASQRARVLCDIAAMLRQYGREFSLVVAVTNHMTTKFDRSSDDDGQGWLAPALGDTWAHQPSTQLRFERQSASTVAPGRRPLCQATLTKSLDQPCGRSCLFDISEAGLRDVKGLPFGALPLKGPSVIAC